jgi:endonuclease/exonuclease/phosphatase family metal-dependent hydrolase
MLSTLMTYNLYEGGFGGGGRRLDLAASVVRAARPDVLGLCEAHGMAEDPRRFTDFCAAVGMRGRIVEAPSGYHVALLARLPHAVLSFEAADVGGLNPAGVGVLRLGRLGDVRACVAHFDYAHPLVRQQEAEALVSLLDAGPRLVLGDLNALSHLDGLTRQDLLALPLHHVERHVDGDGEIALGATRVLERAGLVDAWRAANPAGRRGDGLTVPTAVPEPARFGPMRIDYVFLSEDLAPRLRGCRVVREEPADRASDHYPVAASLELDAA